MRRGREPRPGHPGAIRAVGDLAIDCAQPKGPENEYSIYAVSPSGEATLTYARGEPYRDIVYEIRAAARVADVRLALQVSRMPERILVDLVLLKESDGVRVWSSHTPDGRMLVLDGVITGNGKQSPRFERCGQ
jgi:hypothetical protein